MPLGSLVLIMGLACNSNSNGSSTYGCTINGQPTSQAVSAGTPATFSVTAWGVPIPTYQWQRSNDGGNTWTPISGATGAMYTFYPFMVDNNAQFNVVVTNSVNSVTSTAGTLSVVPSVYAGGFQPGTLSWANPNADPPTSGTQTEMMPGYWLNGTWTGFTSPSGWGSVNAMAVTPVTTDSVVTGSNIYAAGAYQMFSTTTGVLTNQDAGYWLSGTWVDFPTLEVTGGAPQATAAVQALVATSTSLYGAGWQVPPNQTTPMPGYWLNNGTATTWNALPLPNGATSGEGMALALSSDGSTVYTGGYVMVGSNMVPALWANGTQTATPLPGGATTGEVLALATSGTNVYAAGYTNTPGYWLNGAWLPLPLGGMASGQVTGIGVSGTSVYAVGYVQDASGNQTPGYWLNGAWTPLALPTGETVGAVSSVVLAGSDVYAGGFVNADNTPANAGNLIPGYWLDGTWTPFTGSNGNVLSLVVIQ